MTTSAASVAAATPADQPQGFVVRIVGAAAFAHLLNDLIQAVLPSIYPMPVSYTHLTLPTKA